MADINYTVNQDFPENIEGFEQYSQEDRNLLDSFQINSTFNPDKNYSELHILSLSDELLESDYLYNRYTELGNAQSAGQEGASVLTIDPIADSKYYGYDGGGIKLLYHFLDDLYTDSNANREFFIQDISPDRTEVVLNSLDITQDEVISYTSAIKNKLDNQSYFAGFRLNFKENDLIIATNIDTIDSGTNKVIVVKLYEPLPDIYDLKSTLTVVEIVSDSIAYEVDSEFVIQPEQLPTLRSANFNIEIADENVIPTAYQNYNELFSYPVSNANNEVYSAINEKGIKVNVDYTDFNEFVHFSSAEERLLNFKYKVDLLSSYSASISSSQAATTGLQGVSGSRVYYEGLITGVVSNFDHYERFLYYESGSGCWPKSNTTKPYTNKASSTPEAITWFAAQRSQATYYDQTNYNSLINSIPTYLRDDVNNDAYLTFIYMVGQHFDNLWLYAKAVTDKYDGDNRPDKGISKDLVGEALKNFGVKLYTSNKSIQDLFSTFVGQAYQSGSEKINTYITGSLTGSNTPIQPTSYDDYQKEVQKRIYHNLPLLLKSKGTERGLRALINCFGIPADILDIKLYGGRNTTQLPFFGNSQYVTSSLDKIRLDNTGSIVSGNTLSNHTSIVKRDSKYTDDLHAIEIGFSPTDNIDNYIISKSAATFNLDEYLGDPRNLYTDSYSGLYRTANTLLSSSLGTSSSYDLQDYVRLIKFFDNTVFKMVNDFIPARSNADVGVIIKPNILNISKAKSVIMSGSKPDYTGSIDTAFISSQNANTFKYVEGNWSTSYKDYIQTPTNYVIQSTQHFQEQATYNGELSGSFINVSNRDLNKNNPYRALTYTDNRYDITFVSSSNEVCTLQIKSDLTDPIYIDPTKTYTDKDFYSNTNPRTVYSASNPATAIPFTPEYLGIDLANGHTFSTGLNQYDYFYIKADNWDYSLGSCTQTVTARYGVCDLTISGRDNQYSNVVQNTIYNITGWFNTSIDEQRKSLEYVASYGGADYTITSPQQYKFTQPLGTVVSIKAIDPKLGTTCQQTIQTTVMYCNLASQIPPSLAGFEFKYSYWTLQGDRQLAKLSQTDKNSISRTIPATTGNSYITSFTAGFLNYPTSTIIRPNDALSPNRTKKLGIQGYFKGAGTSNISDIFENDSLRYNIYSVRYNKTNNGTYNIRRISTQNMSADDTLRYCQLTEQGTGATTEPYLCQDFLNDKSTAEYRTNQPITIQNDSENYIESVVDNNGYITRTTADKDVYTLIYAYVVVATNITDTIPCTAQVIIYGDHTNLEQIEGVGTYPYYTNPIGASNGKYLLVGWDYSNGITPAGSNTYPNHTSDYGPWIELPIRKFTNKPTVV